MMGSWRAGVRVKASTPLPEKGECVNSYEKRSTREIGEVGGGLAAFLALRSDGLGEAANKFGAALRDASGASVPRLELPEGVVSAMKDLDLKDPNRMSDAEYVLYSAWVS